MRLLFAPDSFKGSLTSLECIGLLKDVANQCFVNPIIHSVPVADGGEGTVDAILEAVGGEVHFTEVQGPTYKPVTAKYGMIPKENCAVIEMAQASGLPLMPYDGLNPRTATTYGTGQLIEHVIKKGVSSIIMGIGGSATNDGGMGCLQALGARFLDEKGDQVRPCGGALAEIRHIDLTQLNHKIKDVQITVICDVNNPLLGPRGATYVYGPQKGADSQALIELEAGMTHYAELFMAQHNMDIASFPGAGAAGGMGAMLKGVLGATLKSGIDTVLEIARFEELLDDTDLVVTGEGRFDGQSVLYNKVPAGIVKRCQSRKIPVAILTGGMGKDAELIYEYPLTSIIPIVNQPMTLDFALENAQTLYRDAAVRMFRFIQIGQVLK